MRWTTNNKMIMLRLTLAECGIQRADQTIQKMKQVRLMWIKKRIHERKSLAYVSLKEEANEAVDTMEKRHYELYALKVVHLYWCINKRQRKQRVIEQHIERLTTVTLGGGPTSEWRLGGVGPWGARVREMCE